MQANITQVTPDMTGHIARAASVCYDSDPDNTARVRGIVAAGHLSCLRFATATIEITGISRACSHQLVRHAHLSCLQRSQRYVTENEMLYVTPPTLKTGTIESKIYSAFMWLSWKTYSWLLKRSINPEDARYVLPSACETKLVVTGNMQAWRDFLYGPSGRLQKAAQCEIREVAKEIERLLTAHLPVVFGPERFMRTHSTPKWKSE